MEQHPHHHVQQTPTSTTFSSMFEWDLLTQDSADIEIEQDVDSPSHLSSQLLKNNGDIIITRPTLTPSIPTHTTPLTSSLNEHEGAMGEHTLKRNRSFDNDNLSEEDPLKRIERLGKGEERVFRRKDVDPLPSSFDGLPSTNPTTTSAFKPRRRVLSFKGSNNKPSTSLPQNETSLFGQDVGAPTKKRKFIQETSSQPTFLMDKDLLPSHLSSNSNLIANFNNEKDPLVSSTSLFLASDAPSNVDMNPISTIKETDLSSHFDSTAFPSSSFFSIISTNPSQSSTTNLPSLQSRFEFFASDHEDSSLDTSQPVLAPISSLSSMDSTSHPPTANLTVPMPGSFLTSFPTLNSLQPSVEMENSTSACPSNLSPLDTATSLSTVETKRVTSLNFMDYTKQLSSSTPHMEATQSNGTKLYFPYRTPNLLPVVPPSSNASTLFQSDSIYTLLHDLRMKMSMEEIPPSSSLNRMGSPLLPHETQLWVDQFQPRKYVDLINDETVSRNVLTWLKSWDIKRSSRRSTHLHEDDVSMGSSMDDVAGVPVDVEKEKKILLLAGPPGLGKTTLIHVIAEQAGYRCMEFNTSDDRTSSMFLPRLQALTGSYTFHQGQLHSQPILVILEELEGMDAAGVLALVQFLQHPSPPPMVGICNDPYGHALKPLRAIAQLIVMRPPTHLAPRIQRLHSICQQHPNLTHVSPAYLRTLVETHQGDLRACLNQLQFLASSPSMTKMTNVFMTHGHEKDLPCSFSDALALLFQSPASVSSSSSSSMTKKRTLADIWSKWTYQDPDRFSMACLDRYLAPHMVHFDQISSVLTTLAEMTSFSTSSQFHVVGYFGFRLFKHTTPHLVPTSFFSKSLDTSHPPIRPSYLSLPTSGTSSSSSSSWILDHRHRLAGDLQGFWNPHTWVLEFWGAFPRLLEIHKMNSVSQPRVEQVVHYLRAYQIKLVASTKEDGSRGFRMEPLRVFFDFFSFSFGLSFFYF
ncbi:hypothetical protein HMI54_012941 [Coelomomyces lativittatus]|nr:hypothetical protein HMI54_012941 [Coelomomyces lativittatus]